jgi:hypothetical protein
VNSQPSTQIVTIEPSIIQIAPARLWSSAASIPFAFASAT